jgi:hypothetical protein
VGAGGALMPGVNRLPPVGLMPFSVGDGGAALDDGGVVVVVVVVVVVEGVCSPLLPHPARSAPIAISAPPPTTATKRRVNGSELMKFRIRYADTVHKLCHGVPLKPAANTQPSPRDEGGIYRVTDRTASASSGRHTIRSGSLGSGRLYSSGAPSRRDVCRPAARATATGAAESHSYWPPAWT